MQETYILAPGASSTELLRTLARFGSNTLGVRIMNSAELAKTALIKSGITVTESYITPKESASVIYSFINGIAYFGAASYSDAENLSTAINTMRGLITDNEAATVHANLAKGEFPDKNSAVAEAYDRYMATIATDKRIDNIGLIRKAIESGKAFSGDFVCLEEFPLSPIEKKLLEVCSAGKYSEQSLPELFGKESVPVAIESYTEGYGSINEIQNILTEIYENQIPLDQCLIACAGNYSQLLYDISQQYQIPLTYGSGIPIMNSNPAVLLKLLYEWNTSGYNGIDALKKLLLSESFDRSKMEQTLGLEEGAFTRRAIEKLAEVAGSLRISFDAVTNSKRLAAYKGVKNDDVTSQVEILAKEFELGFAGFLRKYAIIRPLPAGRIDQSAINVITEYINAYTAYSPDGSLEDIVEKLLEKTVSSESSKQGCLHITSIGGALSSMRENLWVCGLSAADFPGSPREDYLLLDSDLELFADKTIAPTTENKINDKKQSLYNVLSLASCLGTKIKLSYSGYDLAELKERNPSSVLFGIYEEANPGKGMADFQSNIKKAAYFEDSISRIRYIGEAHSKRNEISFKADVSETPKADNALERVWSPSALEVFFQCPRRFYLKYITRIPEEEPDNPFEVINAAQLGTLAHAMMEDLAKEPMSEADFIKACNNAFDEFLITRPPLHDTSKERDDFIRMMRNAFRRDPGNEVLSAETEYTVEHPAGVKLHGYPDRVEKDADGKYIIADFKTKRRYDHIENDIDSCLQVIIYAWMCEQNGIDIDHCDYRYIRKARDIFCNYDSMMKQALTDKLSVFRTAIENNEFPRNPGKGNANCKFCKYGDICNWQEGGATND